MIQHLFSPAAEYPRYPAESLTFCYVALFSVTLHIAIRRRRLWSEANRCYRSAWQLVPGLYLSFSPNYFNWLLWQNSPRLVVLKWIERTGLIRRSSCWTLSSRDLALFLKRCLVPKPEGKRVLLGWGMLHNLSFKEHVSINLNNSLSLSRWRLQAK